MPGVGTRPPQAEPSTSPQVRWCLRMALVLLAVCCAVRPVGGRRRGRRDDGAKRRKDGGSVAGNFVPGLPEGCGGRQSTNIDIFDFFTDAVAGKKTRAEIQAQADWIINDLELECTPRVRSHLHACAAAAPPAAVPQLTCLAPRLGQTQ